MANGKIQIEYKLRPCIVHIPEQRALIRKANEELPHERIISPAQDIKALFHTWNTSTGEGIVEYEDGTVYEAKAQNIKFVDNVMREYAFPEKKENKYDF